MPEVSAPETPQTGAAEKATHRRSSITEWSVNIAVVIFAIGFLVQSFVIPTISMEDTLLRGDHLLVDKLSYSPAGSVGRLLLPYTPIKRGDIIVFRWPIDIREMYVKRVIGIPGDRIRIVNKQLFLNGKAVTEPYKVHKTPYQDSYRDNFPGQPNVKLADPAYAMLSQNLVNGAEILVPADFYFALGDNRDNSLDSRYWGFVPRANIVGKPLIIWWSYDAPTERLADRNIISPGHLWDLATNFFRKTRWQRTFKVIRGYSIE